MIVSSKEAYFRRTLISASLIHITVDVSTISHTLGFSAVKQPT
jgi:hypothetical protein